MVVINTNWKCNYYKCVEQSQNDNLELTSCPAENQAVELEWIQITCSPAVWDVNVNRPSIAYILNTFHTANSHNAC